MESAVDPPSPAGLLREILPQFGLGDPEAVCPWPYVEDHRRSINRLVARFTCAGQCYLLKARTVEHRGTRALFETQRFHKALHQRGVPVPRLHAAPNGETLIQGPNPRDEAGAHYEVLCFLVGPEFFHVPAVYYEIQHYIVGQRPAADEQTARQIGAVLARFHAAGAQPTIRSRSPEEWQHVVPHIDTFLLNKSMYINDFIKRGAALKQKVHAYVEGLEAVSAKEKQQVAALLDRIGDRVGQSRLRWGIIHGNFCLNNVLAGENGLYIIDLDEAGLGPVSHDVGEMLVDLEQAGPQRAFLQGYLENGGQLSEADRTDVVDGMVFQKIAVAFKEEYQELAVERLFAEGWAVF